jgi:predicted esterase
MTRHESTPHEEAAVGLRFLYRSGAHATAPLVVLVHGRAGDRTVMWMFERSIPADCHVVSFEAFLPDALGGWSWWDISSPGSKSEAILVAADRLSRALEGFLAIYSLTPTHRIGLGFSQGSILVSGVALKGLFEFDGVGVLAGAVFRPIESSIAGGASFFIAHGSLDQTIAVTQARAGAADLEKLGFKVQYVEEEVGHKVGVQGTRALKGWLMGVLGRSE